MHRVPEDPLSWVIEGVVRSQATRRLRGALATLKTQLIERIAGKVEEAGAEATHSTKDRVICIVIYVNVSSVGSQELWRRRWLCCWRFGQDLWDKNR